MNARPSPAPTRVQAFDPGRLGLPPELLADPRLNATAKLIAAALVTRWARVKDHCWPSDPTIARAIGRSPGHVQRCLRLLERAGWIVREATAVVPGGRRIWLCWRTGLDSAGAGGGSAPARELMSAPARDKPVVIVNSGREPEYDRGTPQRQRLARPAPTAGSPLGPALMGVLGPLVHPLAQTPGPEAPGAGATSTPTLAPAASPRDVKTPRPTEERRPAAVSDPTPASAGLDQEAIERVPASPDPSAAQLPPAVDGPGLDGLTTAERALVGELSETTRRRVLQLLGLGDRICLNEARTLLAPPMPPEPPPQALTTPELLLGLPGRPDRVMAAAGRLCEELGDARSLGYYRKLATSVCAREHPAEALVEAWQEALGPRVVRPGAVFATAWKRSSRAPDLIRRPSSCPS